MNGHGTACRGARLAISERLDGELDRSAARDLDRHLEHCTTCRAWALEAGRLHARLRVESAPSVPDLTDRVLRAIGPPAAVGSGWWQPAPAAMGEGGLRVVLVVVALTQIAVALPGLVLGEQADLPVHTARHLGSFSVALGIGFLFAAWRPARVAGVLAVAAAVLVCLLATSALDVVAGRAAPSSELAHVPEALGVATLWLLARTQRRPWPAAGAPGRARA